MSHPFQTVKYKRVQTNGEGVVLTTADITTTRSQVEALIRDDVRYLTDIQARRSKVTMTYDLPNLELDVRIEVDNTTAALYTIKYTEVE